MDKVPINKLSLEEKENQDEKMKKKISRGDSRFIRKARRRGEIVDYLGQDSSRYNYSVKYTPPSQASREESIVPDGQGGMDITKANKSAVSMIIPLLIDLDEVDKFEEEKHHDEQITI